jgi:Heterokaryon incompatibility protein (HET)
MVSRAPVQYQYEPLSNRSEIRVLVLHPGLADQQLQCTLKHVSLDQQPPEYTAISYVWGNPSKMREIRCGNGLLHITNNLDSVLRHLRDFTEDRVLWVDAICRDQQQLSTI